MIRPEQLTELETQLKALIVDSLALEDVRPDDIDPAAPLFGEGLSLDSIDALELAMAVSERFGIEFADDTEANRKVFASVRTLAAYVAEHGAAALP